MDNEGDSLFSGLFAGSCFHGKQNNDQNRKSLTYQRIYPSFWKDNYCKRFGTMPPKKAVKVKKKKKKTGKVTSSGENCQ